MTEELNINIYKIMQRLPHRYPFLLIDRVTELKYDKSIKAIKNVTISEPFFQGHFPEFPVFPGVLVIESMAQATGILTFETIGDDLQEDSIFMLAGINNTRFKRQVIPGDTLDISIDILGKKRNVWRFDCTATVDGQLACSAEIIGVLTTMMTG